MDRADDSTLDLSHVTLDTSTCSLTPPRRPRGDRLTFRVSQLALAGDVLVDRATGVVLGKLPPGLSLRDVERLTVTSAAIEVDGDRLVTCCSGPCRGRFALLAMGLRHIGAGALRNQPQCPECRGRYARRRQS